MRMSGMSFPPIVRAPAQVPPDTGTQAPNLTIYVTGYMAARQTICNRLRALR
jgi:hypothetical protein